eukprot:COSAG02_NODE_2528_length_8603_cov_109.592780_9_plen_64_part_00
MGVVGCLDRHLPLPFPHYSARSMKRSKKKQERKCNPKRKERKRREGNATQKTPAAQRAENGEG